MSDAEHVFDWVQGWYAAQCDGEWEHGWGVTIETLDNPGWRVEIDLAETVLEDREYPRREVARGEDDWVQVWTSRKTFHVACGPGNLTEALELFRAWVVEGAAEAL